MQKHLSTEGAYVPHTNLQPNCGCNLRIATPKVTILVWNWYSACMSVWKLHSLMHKPFALNSYLTLESSTAKMHDWFDILDYKSCRDQHCKIIHQKPPGSSSWLGIIGFAKLKPNWRILLGNLEFDILIILLQSVRDALQMSPVIDYRSTVP